MTCPDCSARLASRSHGGVRVARCPECGGAWVGSDDLHRRLGGGRALTPIAGLQVDRVRRGARICATCSEPMMTAIDLDSGLSVDWCVEHGIWLDAGELDALLERANGTRDSARMEWSTVADALAQLLWALQ